jgi:hypothetical protein
MISIDLDHNLEVNLSIIPSSILSVTPESSAIPTEWEI